MDQGLAAIIVGLITTLGGILVALIQMFRRENRKDHASVSAALLKIHFLALQTKSEIGKVGLKLDKHLMDHEKENHDIATRRDQSGDAAI